MKILFDYQIFSSQKYGGISRYFYELIKELRNFEDVQIDISLILSNNYYISDNQIIKHKKFLYNKHFLGKVRLMNIINNFYSITKLKKQFYDVFHPTYYNPYFLKYIKNKPFVLTVYDMIHEKFPEFFQKRDLTSKNKEFLCKKASKIIAISKNTKKDLIEIFGIEESKITVVYLANSIKPNNKTKLDFEIPENYILYVGSRNGYKNFRRFIESISNLLKEYIDLKVVCVGGGKFNDEEKMLFSNLKIENKMFQYELDDNTLAFFYKNAEIFVFPSLYEGFGIPILEAFANKCPVVCSNTSSFPEIAKNGAEYFNPYDEISIFKAVKNVIYDKNKRKQLIENGLERLKNFSWKKTALETKKLYESLL